MSAYPIELEGARWATDAACLVREGMPLPESYREDADSAAWPWLYRLPARARSPLIRALTSKRAREVGDVQVHPRFRFLLRQAERLDLVRVNKTDVIRCWKDGQIVALIAAMTDLGTPVPELLEGVA